MGLRRRMTQAAWLALALFPLLPGTVGAGVGEVQAPAVATAVQVRALDGASVSVSGAQIAALPHVRVQVVQRGEAHAFEGPLLSDLLARAGAPLGPALRGRALAIAVRVRASDGYVVALGLGDVDPALRRDRVILADRVDGHALAADQGPLRLVVEGDLRPARAVRMVESVSLVDLAAR